MARPQPPPAATTSENAAFRGSSKRERILRAAVDVFAEHGYFNAKVAQIAKAAGVADGTIYLYFDGKEDLLVAPTSGGQFDMNAVALSVFSTRTSNAIRTVCERASTADADAQPTRLPTSREPARIRRQRDEGAAAAKSSEPSPGTVNAPSATASRNDCRVRSKPLITSMRTSFT